LHPRVVAELAAIEHRAALAPRLQAVLRGDDHPKDASEGLDFALIAYHARQFGSSARLYAESFRAEPKLADDMAAQHRYIAACAAAQAVDGKSDAEPPLDGPAKSRWRQQALDWLRGDLAYGTMLVRSGVPVAKEIVKLRLRRWKVDPALAGIRDETVLAELSHADRRHWRDFWAEVEALMEAP
jgi:hypothetical protein